MADQTRNRETFPALRPTILATKLYRPVVSPNLLARTELVTLLEGNRQRALTLISAPTGYGKSILASMWLDASDVPGCWVSLDEDDNDPYSFLAYIVAAIASAFPDLSLQTQMLLDTSDFPPASSVARILLNDLEQFPRQLLLVLDDLHVIRNRVIYDLLAELLRYPSPHLHLVLISRRDPPLPIPTLRAFGQLTEIRAQELRFTSAETAGLLTNMLNLEVDEETAAAWTQRAEGWVMALHLAALSLRGRNPRDIDLKNVRVENHYLSEYLLAEILGRMDPARKEWLLAIACLDRFSPALCAAVAQPDGATTGTELTGKGFIEWLQRENLFIIPLDDEHQWFRFHHLFRHHIRAWRQKHHQSAQIGECYRRAGNWFADEGFIDEAIMYLVLAEDFAVAERLVLRHRYDLMNAEQWHRLSHWLRHFPDSALESSAVLMSTVAVMALHRGGTHREIDAALQKVEQLLPNLEPLPTEYNLILGELSIVKGFLAVALGNLAVTNSSAQRGLQLLPANALALRAIAWGELATGMQMSGRFAEGYDLLSKTIYGEQWTRAIQVRLMAYLCMITILEGDVLATQKWARRVHTISKELQLPFSLNYARYFLGVTHFLRGESEAAEPYLSALIDDQAMSTLTYMAMGAITLSLIRDEQGDFDATDAILDTISTHFIQAGASSTLTLVEAFSVELALRRGDFAAAQLKQIGVNFDSRPPLWFIYIPQLTPIKLLIAEGTPQALAAARADLSEFEEQMSSVHRNLARLEALVLLAVVCDAQGDTGSADAYLVTALTLARDGHLIRPFVDAGRPMVDLLNRLRDNGGEQFMAHQNYVTDLLAALTPLSVPDEETVSPHKGKPSTAPAAIAQIDSLTDRELQVLQLLATDCTPAEIAARNVVSIATVRAQIKSIYRKLDVHTRIEAINRGRELQLF